MANLSSINFKKSIAINTEHNDRTLAPNYLLVKNGNFECNNKSEQAKELKNKIVAQAIENYTKTTKQKFQAKSYEWSAVVNIKSDTTMQELENLAQIIEKKHGFQCYQIAIHRDEGHINENNEQVINEHAHLEFITLDKHTGKNRQRELTPQKLRELQTLVANCLKMNRGTDKRISKVERIEPRKYAILKEQEKNNIKELKIQAKEQINKLENELQAEILSKKEIKAQFESFRKENANQGLSKEFFRELSEEKKKQLAEPSKTQEELNKYFKELVIKHTSYKKKLFKEVEIIDYVEIIKDQQKTINDLNAQNSDLKQLNTKTIDFIDESVENALKVKFERLKWENEIKFNKELEQERKNLQEQTESLINLKKSLKEQKSDYEIKYSLLSEQKVIIDLKAEKNKEIESLKQENIKLKKENDKLKELLIKANKKLLKATQNIKKLSKSIQKAAKTSFSFIYDREYSFKSKRISFKEFFRLNGTEQDKIIKSNKQALKDIEKEQSKKLNQSNTKKTKKDFGLGY